MEEMCSKGTSVLELTHFLFQTFNAPENFSIDLETDDDEKWNPQLTVYAAHFIDSYQEAANQIPTQPNKAVTPMTCLLHALSVSTFAALWLLLLGLIV